MEKGAVTRLLEFDFLTDTDHCSKEDEECNAALKREEEQSGVNVEVLKKSNG